MAINAQYRTVKQDLESGAKYAGTSGALSLALVNILMFFMPDWQPIAIYLVTVLTFGVNLIMVLLIKTRVLDSLENLK
jgi:ABC-type transport system involved in Fe-S cluster assembly fused permease/ATPase subunit